MGLSLLIVLRHGQGGGGTENQKKSRVIAVIGKPEDSRSPPSFLRVSRFCSFRNGPPWTSYFRKLSYVRSVLSAFISGKLLVLFSHRSLQIHIKLCRLLPGSRVYTPVSKNSSGPEPVALRGADRTKAKTEEPW